MLKKIIFSAICCLFFSGVKSQIDQQDPLFIELEQLDSIFFERSFNRCDLAYLEQVIDSDLRFYHDQSGFQDRASFFASIKANICNGLSPKPIRKLVPNSLEVFPMYDNGKLYGVIQNGVHDFYLREPGKADLWTSRAKFTTVWIKEAGTWKITEVLSFDHQEPNTTVKQKKEMEALLLKHKVPALGLGIIEDGKLTKIEVYGTLDQSATAPHNTIFKVASLTKPVFALTVLKLMEKGSIGLDEPLYPYWVDPDVKNDKRHKKLTPRLVLSHQTGFPNWRYLKEDNKLAFEFEPGTKFQYSGEGFEYLRKAIENKLGESIEDLASKLLFKPAGMTDTRFWWDETMDESRYANNYDVKGVKIPSAKYYEANAAANLLSTVEDYGRFLAYVMEEVERSKPLFEEMKIPQVERGKNVAFGLGWEILTGFSNGEYALLHSGKDPGVSTLAVLFPASKNGYLIFMNGDNVFGIYEKLLKGRLYKGSELWDRR